MTSRRSALRTWVVPPTFISDNPRLRRSSTIENRHNANTPWPPGRRHLAGHRSRSSLSTKTSGFPVQASSSAMVSPGSPPKSPSAMSGSCSASKSPASPATTPIGIACSCLTDTLIGDADGIYHPAMFNDRLLLGLKGTMSEAELHIIRARLNGGIRNKAARGELRRGLPVGLIWGEEDGEVRFHPDEAVCSAIRTVFARFAELGSVRRVWLWFRSEGLSFPLQTCYGGAIRWVDPS